MRLNPSEKQELILMVERSELGIRRSCRELGINRSSFYQWYRIYQDKGLEGLLPAVSRRRGHWNQIPPAERNLVVELALDHPELSCRELSCKMTDEQQLFISESSVYRILKSQGLITTPQYMLDQAAPEFSQKTLFVHEMWQTDFTYFKILGWGWYYLITILDDYSRFILHWELCKQMEAGDVKQALETALERAAIQAGQKPPRLLSDNGPCFISSELREFLEARKMTHTRGRPLHPQTQGKIERYHRSMKNTVKLNNYYFPEELRESVGSFVRYYNHERYHESLDNVTPADVYYGRKEEIINRRKRVKERTLKRRRKLNRLAKISSASTQIRTLKTSN
jgi:transposase InsO family protein